MILRAEIVNDNTTLNFYLTLIDRRPIILNQR